MSLDDDLSDTFSRLTLFSIANDVISFRGGHNQEILEYLKSPMSMQILHRFRHAEGPEVEAFVEKLFGPAIETEHVGLVEFLLQNTDLDPSGLILKVDGVPRTPIERASQLQNIGLAKVLPKVLLSFQANVNKTYVGPGGMGMAEE